MTVAKLAILCLLSISIQAGNSISYNVVDFGAGAGGKTDSTSAFLKAWTAACKSDSKSTIVVPKGTFFVNSLSFKGPCKTKMKFQISGHIVAPNSYKHLTSKQAWITFHGVKGLSVSGGGSIDSKGASYWACKTSRGDCPFRARSMAFQSCDDVLVSSLKSLNSQGVHIQINECNNITMQALKLIAPGNSPNTDGIHIGNSKAFRVISSDIATGDDCISIGPGSTDMTIENIRCGPGHGISIGSLGDNPNQEGVEDIFVRDSIFTNTQNGARIKTWAKKSTCYVRNVVFENLEMRNVSNPIIIDQEYCPMKNCPKSSSSVQGSDVTFKNIHGTSPSKEAITLLCSSTKPCKGIKLQNINLRSTNKLQLASSNCRNAQVHGMGNVLPKC